MEGAQENISIQAKCLRLLLKPVVRYALRHGHGAKEVASLLKLVTLEAAEEELKQAGEKINLSRLAVASGLSRDEISKIYKGESSENDEPQSITLRVVSAWEQDKRFLTKAGKPRVLSYKGQKSDFNKLVESVGTHIHASSVLFGLERTGIVKKTEKGIKLLAPIDVVQADREQAFKLLSHDIDALIMTVEQNVDQGRELANLHISTEYTNIFQAELPQIRQWLINEGKAFHKRVRDYLSQFDKDITPEPPGESRPAGATVTVSAFGVTSQE